MFAKHQSQGYRQSCCSAEPRQTADTAFVLQVMQQAAPMPAMYLHSQMSKAQQCWSIGTHASCATFASARYCRGTSDILTYCAMAKQGHIDQSQSCAEFRVPHLISLCHCTAVSSRLVATVHATYSYDSTLDFKLASADTVLQSAMFSELPYCQLCLETLTLFIISCKASQFPELTSCCKMPFLACHVT